MSPDRLTGTVAIPVTIHGNQFVPADGTDVPRIRDGTRGHLVVATSAIVDPPERHQLALFASKPSTRILEPRERLLINVGTDASCDEELACHVVHLKPDETERPTEGGFVEAYLLDALELRHGRQPPALGAASCWIPALRARTRSVNHAYTLISTRFEPDRISHTGNVFDKVFFQDRDGRWKPLAVLRLHYAR